MTDLIVGIDPGLKGALALMKADTGEILDLADMPTKKVTLISGKKKTKVCGLQLRNLFSKWFGGVDEEDVSLIHVVLEGVTSRSGEGHAGAFSFGKGVGAVEAAVECLLGVEPDQPAPMTWKSRLKLIGMTKEQTTAYAASLYPKLDLYSKRKNKKGGYNALDGRGDAVLLCLYARSLLVQ